MDILNNQQIPFSKEIMSDMASLPNAVAANSSSAISFENYLKAVNENIEQQERRERNDYNDRKEYQKDSYIERKDPYAKDRYSEQTSRSGSFASAESYNKSTNKSTFNMNDRNDQRSSVAVASNSNATRDNYIGNEKVVSNEYNKVEKNPIQIGNIYQNRSKDKVVGESSSTGVSSDQSSMENLSIASLAYKIHSLLNVENPGDESLLTGEGSLDEMSMKDILSIISNMSEDELNALNTLVDTDEIGISDLELSNLGEIEELLLTAQQNGAGSDLKTDADKEVDASLPIISDKSGLLNEQDIINFYQSNSNTEKTTSDSLLVESLKANKDMLLTDGNVVSADIILSGSKNKDIQNIDTSMLDLIKQVSSEDNDEDSLLDLIKKIAGDIDTEELSDSSKNVAQTAVKDMSLESASEEVVPKEADLKSSKTLSFDDLIEVINSDTSKNIPETTQEVLVDSESTNVKSESVQVADTVVAEEATTTTATSSLTNSEVVSTLEDALNRLTKSNIVEEKQGAQANEELVEEVASKVNPTVTPVKSDDTKNKVDKAFMITEEENKVIDAMKKSLFTENDKSDKNRSEDVDGSKMISKASADGSLPELNKDALAVASSQSKEFRDALNQEISEENLESDLDSDLELTNNDLSQEEDNSSEDPSGKGNKSLEEVEETYSSDALTVEESVVADSSDNDNPSFKLNNQEMKNTDKVDLSKQSQSNLGTSSNSSSKNDNFVNNFNNQTTEKTAENPKHVSQSRGNPVPVYDLKNSSDIGKLVKSIDQSILKGESKLTVNLYPEHLGKLEIQLAEVAGKMTAKFITESESSHKIMMSQTEALRNHLSEKGIVVDSMEFKFDDSSRQQQQQQQQQAENERRSAARNGTNKKNENRDSSLERDNSINFRAKAKPGIYA